MEEKKDRWAWLKRSDHNYLVPFVIVSTTLVALWLLFFAHNSVLSWIRATMEEKSQQKEMARLKEEIEEMEVSEEVEEIFEEDTAFSNKDEALEAMEFYDTPDEME